MAAKWATRLLLASQAVMLTNAQLSGWVKNQVNASVCSWSSLRASMIQDAVYIDGGNMFWVRGMSDGSLGLPVLADDKLGYAYKLNFSKPFNTTSNFTTLLDPFSKVGADNGATNVSPNYVDGALLANDHEFFLYGGLSPQSIVFKAQDAEDITGYRLTPYGGAGQNFNPGGYSTDLTSGVTRYITFGGAANAPSENKAWYFGGMRSASHGLMYASVTNQTVMPTEASNTLITLDMKTQGLEKWNNNSIPDSVKARANPEVVWVPVGEQGILTVIGGVTFPGYANLFGNSSDPAQSQEDSPGFMKTIDIYDVASGSWYKQATSGDIPGALAQGCAVLATAQDSSSYNIYWYGGYPALKPWEGFSDDVWVLSMPSFIWTKLSTGVAKHSRTGHKCVRPYPDQMMVIGGTAYSPGGAQQCLNSLVQVYNMTSGQWMDSYDPAVYMENYQIPESIVRVIGGNAAGGATVNKPEEKGSWDDAKLGDVFAKTYDKTKLKTYYPYAVDNASTPPREDFANSGGGTPSWVAPVLGVVLGLVFLTALIVGILLWRRRKLLKKNGGTLTVSGTDEDGRRILSWIRGQHNASEKAPTVMTEDTTLNINDLDSRITPNPPSYGRAPPSVSTFEAPPDNTFYEMPDTSRPHEMSDTGLSPVDIIHKHSLLGKRMAHKQQDGSLHSGTVSQDHARSYSGQISSPSSGSIALDGNPSEVHSSAASGSIPAAAGVAPIYENQEHHHYSGSSQGQDRTAGQRPPARNAVISGVSAISERDRTHLRHLSDSSVSSATATLPNSPGLVNGFQHPHHQQSTAQQYPTQYQREPSSDCPPESPSVMGTLDLRGGGAPFSPTPPISPPTNEEREGMDYLTAMPLPQDQQNHRRSAFHESAEDLGASEQQRR